MKFKFYLLAVLLITLFSGELYSQEDNEEATQEQWEYLRDGYAVQAIKLISLRDSLNKSIDSMTAVLNEKEDVFIKCEDDLLALVGTTRTELVEFRRKFEETEKKINNRNSSPEDIRRNYYDEISVSKLLCLPEFSERFITLKKKMVPGIEEKQPQFIDGTYIVVKGDCLWRISEQKLGTPALWPVLWDINKAGVLNKTSLDAYQQTINNPNLIYPGQVLRIPTLNEAQEKIKSSILNLRKRYRRSRD